jgi:hypothetical protein
MNYSLSNMLRAACIGGPPVISGFAYPMETLTSTKADQWYIDGSPVSGQTGSTFQVPLLAYGTQITCGESAAVTVWKPWDIAGVVSVRIANQRAWNSISPNVAATNGQTVRRWGDLVNSYSADNATSVQQPLFRSTGQGSYPTVEFDGTDDVLALSGSELDVYRDKGACYAFIGFRATTPTSGNPEQAILYIATGVSNSRLLYHARFGGANNFGFLTRRLDTDSSAQLTYANDSNYHVHGAELLFSSGSFRLRIDGTQVGSGNYASGSGSSSNTASAAASIGNNGNVPTQRAGGHYTCVILANQTISNTDRSRIERFIGLFGGLNIPLV